VVPGAFLRRGGGRAERRQGQGYLRGGRFSGPCSENIANTGDPDQPIDPAQPGGAGRATASQRIVPEMILNPNGEQAP
jgi:hypothetical protein